MSLAETDIFELCKKALIHYKKEIESFINDDDNKNIKSVLEQCLQPKIKSIDEAIKECEKDLNILKNSFSFLKPRYMAALISYKNSLEKSIKKINQFSEFPLNLEDSVKEKNNVEEILNSWYSKNYIDSIKDKKIHSDY